MSKAAGNDTRYPPDLLALRRTFRVVIREPPKATGHRDSTFLGNGIRACKLIECDRLVSHLPHFLKLQTLDFLENKTFDSKMKYTTPWSIAYNRPIVDGKVQNPDTGEIEVAASGPYSPGPPCVQVTWINLHDESCFKIVGSPFAATMTEVLVEIMEHVKAEVYELVSVNATPYYISVVCITPKHMEEVSVAIFSMKKKLGRISYSEEEKEMHTRLEQEDSATREVSSNKSD